MARETSSGAERKSPARRKSGGSSTLKSVVASAASTDALIDLVEKLGLVDVIVDRVKARIADADVDEIFDEITDYMKRNPEVLVATLGAITVATGLVVWLNSRREWDGTERRRAGTGSEPQQARARKAS